LAETVIKTTGSTSDIIFEALPVDDPNVRRPDITRASQVLGWDPTVSLEEGLKRLHSLMSRPSIDEPPVQRVAG
jgi:nucleoside-diphosphate-sugar epimerase